MPDRAPPDLIEREVGGTRAEFLRGLRLAFPGGVSDDGDRVRAVFGGAAMEITLAPLPPISVGLLRMPLLKVRLRGTAGSPAERAAMLARMDLAMQRGGG